MNGYGHTEAHARSSEKLGNAAETFLCRAAPLVIVSRADDR